LLAAGGHRITLVVRESALESFPHRIIVQLANDSIVEGTVSVTARLDAGDDPDVLWIATKALQLDEALKSVGSAKPRLVVPLLNGIDHITRLDTVFGHEVVIPATIAVEADRVSPGMIRIGSPFILMKIAERGRVPLESSATILRTFGATIGYETDETTLLWSKLAFLAPFALTTTASDQGIGFMRDDPAWRARFLAVIRETISVGSAEGAIIDAAPICALFKSSPETMRSSMWRDVQRGNEPELDAIGGAIVRAAECHAIDVPVTRELMAMVKQCASTAGVRD
jgi:2-dehydropantoate 2-reductase